MVTSAHARATESGEIVHQCTVCLMNGAVLLIDTAHLKLVERGRVDLLERALLLERLSLYLHEDPVHDVLLWLQRSAVARRAILESDVMELCRSWCITDSEEIGALRVVQDTARSLDAAAAARQRVKEINDSQSRERE